MSTDAYRFNHCLSSIARKAEEREATRLARRAWDLDERVRRSCPLWDRRNAATESGTVHRVNKDAKESSRLVVRVLLELGMDLDDERGGYGGEETNLQLDSVHVYPSIVHDTNIRIVLRSPSCFFMNSLSYSSASSR